MNTLQDIQHAIARLPPRERADLLRWMEEADGGALHVAEPAIAYGAHPYLTVDEYLESEPRRPVRHEYINGAIYAMTGASERHNLISLNLAGEFRGHLRGGPCRVYMAEFKVRLQINREDILYYPDVMVACGREGVERYYLRHPKLIVEVLSPSTESIDRREKFLSYTQIPSLEEYCIVAQDRPQIVIHRREDSWVPRWLDGPGAVAEFRSLGLSLTLARIYEDLPA
jgi:Uma2 family endonuclease